MQNKFKITDESGDHKYFTIIPNYIVNHSTPYEQSIYLYMKRVAGETGTCWSSAKTIAKKLNIARNTVAKYQQKLVDRGWIEVVGKKGKTKPTYEYKIVDLWDLNIKYYTKKESSTREQSIRKDKKKVQHVNLDSSSVAHKEEPIKKSNTISKDIVLAKPNGFAEKSPNIVNSLIGEFKEINPSYERLFSNKTQRAAIERLVKKHGEDKIKRSIKAAIKVNGVKYAPRITTPLQLEDKLGDLIAFYKSEGVQKQRVHYAK